MRSILVCVDYADMLMQTLPYNQHHFSETLVVTTPEDIKTQTIADRFNTETFCTSAFYAKGAIFNKWAALEEGLDYFGREGWLCLMDADVLWPKLISPIDWQVGKLYSPERRMMPNPTQAKPYPDEHLWGAYPLHRNKAEWAGYTQIFHASDPVLGPAPWHETNWSHAGGADSFFQRKWKPQNKIRPPFNVLHMGPAGKNWCGRATPYLDGTSSQEADRHASDLNQVFNQRRITKNYDHEKLRG